LRKLLLVFVFITISSSVFAQQSNFSFQTPPIVSPSFSEGKSDKKFGFLYLTMEDDGSLANTDIDMSGGGLNLAVRKALSDNFAVDFSGGVFATSGDIVTPGLKTKQDLTNVNINFNLEIQPFKTGYANMILFVGPTLTAVSGTVETTELINSSYNYNGSLYGVQGGIQFGLKAGAVEVIPFMMVSSMSGDITAGGITTTVDAFTTTSYGLEVMFFNTVSLSSILQKADSSKKNEAGIKANLYQLSFKMNF